MTTPAKSSTVDQKIQPSVAQLHKLELLREKLSKLGSLLVAFSGGVDSSFLLAVAVGAAKGKVIAVTGDSKTLPQSEMLSARAFARSLAVEHIIIKSGEMNDKEFLVNPPDRCFHCKKNLFSRLNDVAQENKIESVIEGSNLSDTSDYRPGFKAVDQFSIISPLRETELTKDDIRALSHYLNLSTWDRPAAPCLSSRIPYGQSITVERLSRIEQSEKYLHSLGFEICRVRDHETMARIEVPVERLENLTALVSTTEIVEKLKSFGYDYVTVDLQGFRSGSLNEALNLDQDAER